MICRLCLRNLNEAISVPIFDGSNNHSDTTLANMISKHFFIELNLEDNISTFICQDCFDRLEDFHRFWCYIDQKQKTLQCEFLEIKCETPLADENLIKTPSIEIDEIGLVDAKLERFEDYEEYSENMNNFDKVDDISRVDGNLDIDIDVDSQDNTIISSDDEIPLVAYKTSTNNEKIKMSDSTLKTNINKRGRKRKETTENGKNTKTMKTETSYVIDSLELFCELCKESVGDFDNLINHFSLKHGGKKAFVKCCGRIFSHKMKLVSHLDWHRNPEEYRCQVCKKVLSSKKYLKLHMTVRHGDENIAIFNCDLCDKKFQSRKRLQKHSQAHKKEKDFKCHVCEKSYTSKHRLQRHIQGTHEFVYPYKCSACGEPFNFKTEFDKHYDNCKNKSLLTRISSGEALDKEKINEDSMCKTCHKIFFTPQQLRRHIESVHENIHPFVCDQCGKKFKFKPAFEKHLLEHSGIIEPPAQCNICGNWLKNKHSLRLHLYRHDGANNKCHLCDRECPSRRALRGHIQNVHRDEKHHKCKFCEKSFKNPKNLEEHIATHTGAQLYSCPHCSKETRSSSNMYVHIKRIHPEEWIKSKLARSHNPNINSVKNNKNDEKYLLVWFLSTDVLDRFSSNFISFILERYSAFLGNFFSEPKIYVEIIPNNKSAAHESFAVYSMGTTLFDVF